MAYQPLEKTSFIFFGSSVMSIYVLDELEKAGFLPQAVVTTGDKPVGRRQILTPNPVKEWARKRNIKIYDPEKLSAIAEQLKQENVETFIVASYGKLIPETILSIPPRNTLNVHPSLLPRYRGASPLQSAILDDAKDTGLSIIRIDAEMDHGPIVAQKPIRINEWPPYEIFEELMAREGGRLLAGILPDWVAGKIEEKEQDHASATFSRKFVKEDGEIRLDADEYLNFRKIQAFHLRPQAFFFIEKSGRRLRIKVTEASWQDGRLQIKKVVPEGAREMAYEDFHRGYSA